jgi:tRNA A37 threonylcarbamoyladenosine biosynthesis protein TsaE
MALSQSPNLNQNQHQFKVSWKDRCVFVGRTGSGKTTLADQLIRGFGYRTAVLDPKGLWEFPGYKLVTEYDPNPNTIRQLFRPRDNAKKEWADADYFLRSVWNTGIPTVVYIDEITKLTTPYGTLEILEDWVRLGRQMGMGGWYASQRPKDVPNLFFTETENWFVFDLTHSDDRKKVAGFTSDAVEERPTPKFSFWHFNPDLHDAVLVHQQQLNNR